MTINRKAWKLCGKCMCSYVAPEYSLMCPACRKERVQATGISISTSRRYEKQLWEIQHTDYAWTLIGYWNESEKSFQIEYIYDCWPDDLKKLAITGEG